MKKQILIGIVLVLSLAMTASAWDVLGHAYIMEQLKGGAGSASANELYGITAPDFVNYLIGGPYYDYLYNETHKDFMRVWHMSGNGIQGTNEQELAFGFVAHNGVWGADYIAHVASLADASQGYVVGLAHVLETVFASTEVAPGVNIWLALGIGTGPEYHDLRIELCHNIVEYIIDVRIWEADASLAGRVAAAAAARDASMPGLMVKAYGKLLSDFSQTTAAPLNHAAADFLLQSYEGFFKEREYLYAGLFASASTLDGVIVNLSGYLSELANALYGLGTTPDQVYQILYLSYYSLLQFDVMSELDGTVNFVRGQMAAHHVVYGPKGIMSRVGEEAPLGRIKR